MTTLVTYLNQGNADPIYLVEFSARKLSDGSLEPLYFSKPAAYFADKQFLPAISALPDIDRAANDTMDPAYLPTYGDLTLLISGAYKPDAANSIAWDLLLYKDTYTFMGQSLTIKIGQPGDAYAAFTTIFTGQLGEVSWTDSELNLTVYDKAQDLQSTKIPDFELPERSDVFEDNWDQILPLVLGKVNNCKAILINTGLGGTYPFRYGIACHVIQSVENVYYDDAIYPYIAGFWEFVQKDLSPPHKNGEGSARLDVNGPYTGALYRADWLIQIDSVAAGVEVGQSTFRWSMDGGDTWVEEVRLTWTLAYDATTLVKLPAVGLTTMTVSGDYTETLKLIYKVKVVRAGNIGDAVPPQIIWSDDGGVTWQPAVDVLSVDPPTIPSTSLSVPLNLGLSVAFSGDSFVVDDLWTFTVKEIPISLADGVSIQFFTQSGDDFSLWDEWTFILISSLRTTSMDEQTSVTVDVLGMMSTITDAYVSSPGDIIHALVVSFLGWDSTADFDIPALNIFNAAIPYEVGWWSDSPTDISSIIDELLSGIPALYSITIDGKFYLQELTVPSGATVLDMTDVEITDLPNFSQTPDIFRRVYLQYDKNWTDPKRIGSASPERAAWLRRGYRQISKRNATVRENYPKASDIGPLETALILRADAGLLAQKLLDLYQIPHETMTIEIGLQAVPLNIGDIVAVIRGTFGQSSGQLYMVQGININFTDRLSEVTLWR